jgi:transposase
MKILKQIVGIDISMDTFEVRFGTTDSNQDQKISNSITFKNSKLDFKKLILSTKKNIISKDIPLFFVMEATGVYYENLAYFLYSNNYNVAVILPNKISNYAKSLQSKSKTDSIDAASITSFGLERKLNPWKPPSSIIKSIKALCREYYSTKANITEIKNQLHAKKHSHKPDKSTISRKTKLINLLTKQSREIETQLKTTIQQDKELSEKINRIIKVKGLGFISVVTTVAETNAFELISNQKQLASYAGLDVVFNDSGIKKGKTSISKKGNKFLRKAVFMPALSAVRHNHNMKELYKRLVAKGKNKKLALIAVARKLLLLIYTLWKNNTEYIPNYNPLVSI